MWSKSIVSPKPGGWDRSRAGAHSTGISVNLARLHLKWPGYTGSNRTSVVNSRTSTSVIDSPIRYRRPDSRSDSQSSRSNSRAYALSYASLRADEPAAVAPVAHVAEDQPRADVLTAAYAPHPERFVGKPPSPPALPSAAWINRPVDNTGDTEAAIG